MRKLGLIASLLFLSVTTLIWTGCSCSSRYHRQDDCCYNEQTAFKPCQPVCQPTCEQPCCPPSNEPQDCAPKAACPCPPKPVCPPAPCPPPCPPKPVCAPKPCAPEPCPPKCAAPLKPCKYGPQGECSCNGITVRARNPKMCILGNQYPLDLEVIGCVDVCEAEVTTTLPDGVSYIRSQPEAKVDGRKLTWQFGHISKGQTVPVRVWLKCECEGDQCTCFCVSAKPVAFCALLCAQPVLTCEKTATPQACPGEPIHYTVLVTNIGTCTAEDVVITDVLPEGVEHPSYQKTLTFRLGNLEPCQSKKVNFCVTACKRGNVTNTATVTACNANQTSCEATTCVCCCAIECNKVGPKEVPVGQNADYQITVVNTGDLPLHEVVVTDNAPTATSIVTAQGASINGKQAVWKLRELKPGERVTFNITLTTCIPGCFTNRVTVTDCEGCNSSCEAGTSWKGRPALEMCVEVLDNPVCLGETSRIKIIAQNKGQEYDSNVKIAVNLPSELAVVDASGATASQVSGGTVSFAPIPQLAPRQTVEYTVTVKTNGRGDLRPKVQISSDFLRNPITEEQSLIVN